MSFDPSFLENLRQAASLTAYITEHLGRSSRGEKWRCPFHEEKTPSFSVYEESGRYKCFGCQESGDIITFCMKVENLNFPEAVRHLAEKFSLEIPENSRFQSSQAIPSHAEAYDLLQCVCTAYEKALEGPEGAGARAYLQQRGLKQQVIQAFRLGWASGAVWPSGTPLALLHQVGLVNPDTGRPLFFRRLIFPLQDSQGRVIGFGGRVLDQTQPKYLNSPQTSLFSKSTYLYGCYQAKALQAARSKPVVLVEGYIDVLRLYQAGVARALASLGTALHVSQIERLWRLDSFPLVCMDGDLAGQKATQALVRAILPHLKPGVSLRCARLPSGQDPDSFVAEGGSFNQIMQQSLSLVDYLTQKYLEHAPGTIPEEKARLKIELYELLKSIQNPDIRQLYRESLWPPTTAQAPEKRYLNRGGAAKPFQALAAPSAHGRRLAPIRRLQEGILLATGVVYPDFFLEVMEAMALIEPEDSQESIALWKQALLEWGNDPEAQSWEDFRLSKGLDSDQIVTEALARHAPFLKIPTPLPSIRRVWWDIFQRYHLQPLQQRERQEAHNAFVQQPSQATWQRLFHMATKQETPPQPSPDD